MDLFFFSSLVFTASFLVLGAVFHIRAAGNGRKTSTHLPPSPVALPVLGHLHLLRPLLHQAFHVLAMRYGPLFRLHFPTIGNVLVVSSPALAKDFFKSQDPLFAARPHLVANDYLGEASVIYTFLPYGSSWKFLKKLFVAELFSSKKLERTARIREEEIRRLLASLLEKSKLGAPAELEELLTRLSGNIIWRMMIGRWSGEAEEEEGMECQKLVRKMAEVLGKLTAVHLVTGRLATWDLLGYGQRLKHLDERFAVIMEKIMNGYKGKQKINLKKNEEKDEDEDEKDLLDVLLNIVDDESSEFKLTRSNIKSIVKAINHLFLNSQTHEILTAGTETLSDTLSWALAELINHPTTAKKARDEMDSVVGKNRLVNESDIPKLPYIQAICKETMRLHPVVPLIPRRCVRDCTVAGYDIPSDTTVFVNVWAIGRDPDHWANPLEFHPERFLDSSSPNIEVRGQQYQLLPFGSGRKMCLGAPLAWPVMQVALAAMVQCFDWKVFDEEPGGSEKIVEMEEKGGHTLRMAKPLSCIPIARCTPFT
ncbi:hypothetical protein ACLOJK_020299 [Asimina triloba]